VVFEDQVAGAEAGLWSANYDAAPDGRFLMLKTRGAGSPPTQINVVLEWPQELARRVLPAK
jgi:hypothetical protein